MKTYSISSRPKEGYDHYVYFDKNGMPQDLYSPDKPWEVDMPKVKKLSLLVIIGAGILLLVFLFALSRVYITPPVHLNPDPEHTSAEIRFDDPYDAVPDKTALVNEMKRFQEKTNITPAIVFTDNHDQPEEYVNGCVERLYGEGFEYGQYWVIFIDVNEKDDVYNIARTLRTESTFDSNRMDKVNAFKQDLHDKLHEGKTLSDTLTESFAAATDRFFNYNWTVDICLAILFAVVVTLIVAAFNYRSNAKKLASAVPPESLGWNVSAGYQPASPAYPQPAYPQQQPYPQQSYGQAYAPQQPYQAPFQPQGGYASQNTAPPAQPQQAAPHQQKPEKKGGLRIQL